MQAVLRFPRTATLWLAAGGALALAGLFAATALLPVAASTQSDSGIEAEVAQLPLSFEPNAGRAPANVDYLAHSVAGGTLAVGATGAQLALPSGKHETRTLDFALTGAASGATPRGVTELPGKANVFIGDNSSKWRSGLPTFSRVRYEQAYPGIDVDWYGNQRRLEYDFRLAPGADPKQIGLDVSGADSLRVARNGELVIGLGNREIRQAAPVAYQTVGGERRAVASAYELHGSTVGFRLGDYDHSQPLVIDPLVVAYSTYLGGTATESVAGVRVDSSGAAYVSGSTTSSDYPTQDQFLPDQGDRDVYVTKLNPDSGGPVTLAYSTYLGGGGNDEGRAIAIDGAGAAYVGGSTKSTDFPMVDAYEGKSIDDSNTDVFAAKLDPDTGGAVTLAYSTYIGGSGFEGANGMAVDSTGAAYLAGDTDSTDYDLVDSYEGNSTGTDAFLTKINPDPGGAMPVTLGYSTYLGGTTGGPMFLAAFDSASDVAVDSTGAAYVAGLTTSSDFDTVDQFMIDPGDSAFDGFVAKFVDPGGAMPVTLAYSTYLGGGTGGSKNDFARAIAVDSAADAYVTGATNTTDFPTQDPIAGQVADTSGQAFVTKINDPGGAMPVTLPYSTLLGGTMTAGPYDSFDSGEAIAVDSLGAAWIAGDAYSSNPPTVDPLAIQSTDGEGNVLAAKINPDPGGAMPVTLGFLSTFGGVTNSTGDSYDDGSGIALGPAGSVFIAGESDTTDFPTQDGRCGSTGDEDGNPYVMMLAPTASAGSCGGGGGPTPPATTPTSTLAAGPTGQRAAALKKCKKKKGAARKKCKKKAQKLPV